MEDLKIINLLWQRSEKGIDALQKKFGNVLMKLSMNILNHRQDAEESVSDTYLALWNAIPPAKPEPLSSFVYKVGRNTALNRLRNRTAQKRSAYEVSLEELGDIFPGSVLEEQIDARELARCINCFLEELDADSRRLFVRRYWFGDTVGQLATREGIREGNVSVRLHRIRAKLKDYLIREGFWNEE